jgi:hypothetical protein
MLGGPGHSLIDLLGTVREECIRENKKHISLNHFTNACVLDSVGIVVTVLAEMLSVVRKSAESSLPVVDKHPATFGSPRAQE